MSGKAESKYAIVREVLNKADKKRVKQAEVDAAVKMFNEMVEELNRLKNSSSKQVNQESDTSRPKLIEKLEDEKKELQDNIKIMNIKIAELQHRLSSLAGQKMTENNPDIADLSDPFRPTNLAEKFRQVYDDAWTPAYEVLDKKFAMDETKIIDLLANILKEIETVCSQTIEKQTSKMSQYIIDDFVSPKVQTNEGETMVANVRSAIGKNQREMVSKLLIQLRKSLGILSVKPMIELFNHYYMAKIRNKWKLISIPEEISFFVEKCLEVVWLMAIQDPPMALLWMKDGDRCDKDRFTFYTKRGETVKQAVWPAVLLNSGGPLVAKGVIQGN